MADSRSSGSGGLPDPAAESSAVLFARARNGDTRAQNALFARYRPILLRIAHGRLPVAARDLVESKDLVAETEIRAWRHIHDFVDRGEGAFLGYMTKILRNLIRDHRRRARRRPGHTSLPEELPGAARTPLEIAIGREAMEAYESALSQLPDDQHDAVVLRVELGYNYDEVARALRRPTPNAARMLVVRGIEKLARLMQEHKSGS